MSPRRRRLRIVALAALAAVIAALLLAAFVPITFASREARYEIPKGTWARRMAGEKDLEILPSTIYLVAGMKDVLVLKNQDDVPQMFGPTLLMPGQSLSLPFNTPSENQFACTAHSSGQLIVLVEEAPLTPWARLKWRAQALLGAPGR